MSGSQTPDWDPGLYHRFRGLRLRPAIDLLRSVGPLPEGAVIDLGCGSGAVGPALQQLGGKLVGVDLSAAMLEQARRTGCYDALVAEDLSLWLPEEPAALIFSNAALQWVGDHANLLTLLASKLAPGGTLAVQMPHQNNAPSHRFWLSLAEELFPGRIDPEAQPEAMLPAEYHRLLSPLGQVSIWETEYYQDLAPDGEGHPVRRFTEATFARPVLAVLNEDEQAQLITAYERVIGSAYPTGPDGRVLFPFRRLFFTLTV